MNLVNLGYLSTDDRLKGNDILVKKIAVYLSTDFVVLGYDRDYPWPEGSNMYNLSNSV